MILYILIMLVDLICGLPFIWQWEEFNRKSIAVVILFTMVFEIAGIVSVVISKRSCK